MGIEALIAFSHSWPAMLSRANDKPSEDAWANNRTQILGQELRGSNEERKESTRRRSEGAEIRRDFARNGLRIMRQTNARPWKLKFTLSFELALRLPPLTAQPRNLDCEGGGSGVAVVAARSCAPELYLSAGARTSSTRYTYLHGVLSRRTCINRANPQGRGNSGKGVFLALPAVGNCAARPKPAAAIGQTYRKWELALGRARYTMSPTASRADR